MRSDNALEFDDEPCRDFFSKNGIIHQTSCVKRPQQNTRAERKYRHVLEMSRTRRFQAALPLIYWGDCVMTIAYVINRLTVLDLKNKTHYEVLYKKIPEYKHLKVTGCLAFACNLEHSTQKFNPRGVRCVFMGYSPTQKGYKLLNFLTMQMFVSRDALFHENVFPFHEKNEQTYMHPVPNPNPGTTKPIYDDEWFSDDELEQPITHPPDSPNISSPHTNTSPNTPVSNTYPITQTPTPPPVLRRTTININRPRWMQDYQLHMP